MTTRIRTSAALVVTCTMSCAALVALGATTLTAAGDVAAGITTPDALALVGVSGVGTLLAAWYTLSALVLLAARGRVFRGRGALEWCARWGAPGMRRLAVLALTASTTLGGAVAAQATEASPDLGWGARTSTAAQHTRQAPAAPPGDTESDATGAPGARTASPTATDVPRADHSARATPAASASAPEPEPSPGSASTSAPTVRVVRPGDSLWTIARDHLPTDATDAQIDAAWRDWYAVNRVLIGPDADLVRPGQSLTAPGELGRAD